MITVQIRVPFQFLTEKKLQSQEIGNRLTVNIVDIKDPVTETFQMSAFDFRRTAFDFRRVAKTIIVNHCFMF